ncbi:unnamed protein product [Hymenolepis diminuta]|uniref:RING-type domain-containing protein n=1 Tax=Hymenolepis diminuta TaxID=6216 RepID=A0A564YRK5_HYMDI|nr:unnamed protein product [Hymenolepis diminuta]
MIDIECPVCREIIQTEIGTPDSCRHSHCYPCLWNWVIRRQFCPYCRGRLSKIIVTSRIDGRIVRMEPQPLQLIMRINRNNPDKVTIYPIYWGNEELTYDEESDPNLTKIAVENLLWRFLTHYLKDFFADVEALNTLIVQRLMNPVRGPSLDRSIVHCVEAILQSLQHSPQELSQLIIFGIEGIVSDPMLNMREYMRSVDNYITTLQIKALRLRRDLLEWSKMEVK